MRVLERAQQTLALRLPASISASQVLSIALLIGIVGVAAFTRFWRLGTPGEFFFDEVYYPATAQEILRGDPAAWEFFGHENTHPPISKLFMAGGMAVFGENNPFGWRFFGALFGVGAVFFVYLLGRRLFKSEIVGLSAAFLLTLEGLAFAQSRIATPDTYLLFFVLGALYFLLGDRYLLSGVFLGAATATKWTAVWTLLPIALYFVYRFLEKDRRERGKFSVRAAWSVPTFFVLVPFFIYLLSYVPMFAAGRGLDHLWDLNRQAYLFHTGLEADHPYESPPNTWPIMMRPIYFYLSLSGEARIYSLGNPLIFWSSLPALAFVFWQVLRKVRLQLHTGSGEVTLSGCLNRRDAGLLFVLMAYLSFFVPWLIYQPRIMFIYHYLPALAFAILALAYAIHTMWQDRWGRVGAVALLAAAFLAFAYFYPHLAAVSVPGWLAESYFWFPSWR